MGRLTTDNVAVFSSLQVSLVAANILVFVLCGSPAEASIRQDLSAHDQSTRACGDILTGEFARCGVRVWRVAGDATGTEIDASEGEIGKGEAKDVLPWKLGAPNLTFEGFETIVSAATGGLAQVSLPAEDYNFADYMFVMEGAGVGIYWEELSGSRSTDVIMNGVLALLQAICEGEAGSDQTRQETNDTFALRQGFATCSSRKWDSYIAVSVLNFGAASQVFLTIGLAEDKDLLDLINSNITDVEVKVFDAQ